MEPIVEDKLADTGRRKKDRDRSRSVKYFSMLRFFRSEEEGENIGDNYIPRVHIVGVDDPDGEFVG